MSLTWLCYNVLPKLGAKWNDSDRDTWIKKRQINIPNIFISLFYMIKADCQNNGEISSSNAIHLFIFFIFFYTCWWNFNLNSSILLYSLDLSKKKKILWIILKKCCYQMVSNFMFSCQQQKRKNSLFSENSLFHDENNGNSL